MREALFADSALYVPNAADQWEIWGFMAKTGLTMNLAKFY